jgi:hypothetical protein
MVLIGVYKSKNRHLSTFGFGKWKPDFQQYYEPAFADVRNSLWLLPNYVSRGNVIIEGLRNLKTGCERRLLQGMKDCRIGCKKGKET